MNRGFSVIEVVVAMAVLVLSMSAVIMIVYGAQGIGTDSETSREALSIAQEAIERAQASARKDFDLLVPTTSTATREPIVYTTDVSVQLLPDYLTKEIIARVSWHGAYGKTSNVSIASLAANLSEARSSKTCDSTLHDTWDSPSISTWPVAGSVSDIDAAFGRLYLTLDKTADANADSFLIYSTSSLSVPLGGVDIATGTSLGPKAVTVSGTYAYVADGYGADFSSCYNANDASAQSTVWGGTCSQLKVVDIADPAHPRVVYYFKAPGVGGSAGQARGISVAYKDGYLYLGLGKSGSGPEFHVIDVHNPLFPVSRGSYSVGRSVTSIVVRGNYAYLGTDDNAHDLLILDISNPYAPQNAPGAVYNPAGLGLGNALALIGDVLFLGRTYSSPDKELYALDVTNPHLAMPSPLGSYSTAATIIGILIRDTRAFVATGDDKLQILSIADLSHITKKGELSLPGSVSTIECEANQLYAGSSHGTSGDLSLITP